MKSLLLGGGKDWRKRVYLPGEESWKGDLIVADMDPKAADPKVAGTLQACDLESLPLPFPDEEFDEMGAYHILEHLGRQGNWKDWFAEMAEYHRILKPGALFGILFPIGEAALDDPGHTRFLSLAYFAFCSRKFYETQDTTCATDYRWYIDKHHPKLNFDVLSYQERPTSEMAIMLRKV